MQKRVERAASEAARAPNKASVEAASKRSVPPSSATSGSSQVVVVVVVVVGWEW